MFFCDAGDQFKGKLTKSEILAQIDTMVLNRFPNGIVPVPKFKIQFARMGEPSLNPHVLEVLEDLPGLHECLEKNAQNREHYLVVQKEVDSGN